MNYQMVHNPALITEAAKLVGSQSVVVSVDVKKNLFGTYKVYTKNGTENTGKEPADFARKMMVNAPLKIVLVDGMDHFVPWSNPELIRNAIVELLPGNATFQAAK